MGDQLYWHMFGEKLTFYDHMVHGEILIILDTCSLSSIS